MGYYNWNDTLARDALITMVIGVRGVGKTYGLRRQFVKDFIKDGSRFCDISRTKAEKIKVSKDYFSKLVKNEEFKDYIFKCDNSKAYIARKPEEGKKPRWEILGYFVALSEALTAKKETFVSVYRVVFDEALIDKQISPYARYLPNEFDILANLADSITRENVNNEDKQPRLYLLGNAVDMVNPYFIAYGIDNIPEEGYRWYDGKKFLMHYPKASKDDARRKQSETLSGYLASKTSQGKSSLFNEFSISDDRLISRKPSNAKFMFAYRYKGVNHGIWTTYDGYVYVTDKVTKDQKKLIYSLSKDDESVDLVMAKKNENRFLYLKEAYYLGLVRYQSEGVRKLFLEMMRIYGIV